MFFNIYIFSQPAKYELARVGQHTIVWKLHEFWSLGLGVQD